MTTVAVAQIGAELGDVPGNLARVSDGIRRAAEAGADVVVFPETILSGYLFADEASVRAAARRLDGAEVAAVAEVVRACGLLVVIGVLESDGADVFNTAVLLGPGGLIGSYRKLHLPFLGLDRFVSAGGSEQVAVFDTPVGRIGLAICFDIRFPESARCLALTGADLIAQPSVWPASADILVEHMLPARAAENHVFLAAVSRGDSEAGVRFRGNSQIIDPRGVVLTMANQGDELLTASVDLQSARTKDLIIAPGEYEISLWASRRPDAYLAIGRNPHDSP